RLTDLYISATYRVPHGLGRLISLFPDHHFFDNTGLFIDHRLFNSLDDRNGCILESLPVAWRHRAIYWSTLYSLFDGSLRDRATRLDSAFALPLAYLYIFFYYWDDEFPGRTGRPSGLLFSCLGRRRRRGAHLWFDSFVVCTRIRLLVPVSHNKGFSV